MILRFTPSQPKALKSGETYIEDERGNLTYWPKTGSFTTDIHHPGIDTLGHMVSIYNTKTGKSADFYYYKTDKDSTDEDIYGWRYSAVVNNKKIELLIVND